MVGNLDRAAVPADFIARRGPMILACNFERIAEDAHGIVVFIAGGVALAPCGQGFPAKRHDDLVAPRLILCAKPSFLGATAVAIKAELPGAIEVEPVQTFDKAALT